jgi:NADH-quinone oxidoreductase subunit L
MTSPAQHLWIIPALPLLAAGVSALLQRRHRTLAATLAIGSMTVAFFLACGAFAQTLGGHGEDHADTRHVHNFDWLSLGTATLKLGWVLDPLTASMLVMITFVGALIFTYSVGYMAHDENFTRFFTFLSLFAAAMLGLVIANNLLLLFMCWELVGVASYLLIGFWFQKPSAAAAAKKAFITTRIGDLGLLLGMVWLYGETGTLLFYDGGNGCLEQSALTKLVGASVAGGMAVSTAISLLIFCGAVGKSGQVPLHVWLPDAMEGPTPVSALIHAATMVAAGVFLMARVFPLLGEATSAAREVVTWVGAITAIFAALVAIAQTDIKRILAYSTVSQLGFMFMGLGAGGPAVGMFHLLTHAFFKALLFLGAGSVIHGCHEEQDIRRMGGLRKAMPVTFATYAIGMMALAGVPLFFSGFWSKDEILHAAWLWQPSKWPFVLGVCGAFLTAFYMTRQMFYVFFGESRPRQPDESKAAHHGHSDDHGGEAHESPPVMTIPLGVLAFCAVFLSLFATPVWPAIHDYLSGHAPHVRAAVDIGVIATMLLSVAIVGAGLAAGWYFYGRKPITDAAAPDALEQLKPDWFAVLRGKFFVDELYEISFIRWNAVFARFCGWLERTIWTGAVSAVSLVVLGVSWLTRFFDEFVINLGFSGSCKGLGAGGGWLARLHNGRAQDYLRVLGLALVVLVLALIWGGGK